MSVPARRYPAGRDGFLALTPADGIPCNCEDCLEDLRATLRAIRGVCGRRTPAVENTEPPEVSAPEGSPDDVAGGLFVRQSRVLAGPVDDREESTRPPRRQGYVQKAPKMVDVYRRRVAS